LQSIKPEYQSSFDIFDMLISSTLSLNTLEVNVLAKTMDATNATETKAALKELDLQGRERAIIDTAGVQFIDSSGIGALLSFYKKMNQKLTLKSPLQTMLSVLELQRLHRILAIEPE
jgi:anti-sigma B factor antagonist